MPPPSTITAPRLTLAVAGHRSTTIIFHGINLQPGDRVKWVSFDAPSCSSAFDRTPWTTTVASRPADHGAARNGTSGGSGDTKSTFGRVSASFAFPPSSTGLLALCYKFAYLQQDVPVGERRKVAPTPYLLFPHIQLSVIRYDEVLPSGTAVGCMSQLVIRGAGFHSIYAAFRHPDTPTGAKLVCRFGTVAPLVSSTATVLDDLSISCESPTPQVTGFLPLRVDLDVAGGAWSATASHATTFPEFTAYAAGEYSVSNVVSRIDTLVPAGAAYNLQPAVFLTGHFLRSYGTPRCRFGNWSDQLVANATYNTTHVTCRKPRLPDSFRNSIGHGGSSLLVAFSPNGQCFGPPSVAAPFVVFNSQVNALGRNGAPAQTSLSLDVTGEGLIHPALTGASCRFAAKDDEESVPPFFSDLVSLSSTHVRCVATPTGIATAWKVSVLQNGMDAEPSLYDGGLTFTTYDLGRVHVSALLPPGGPVSGAPTSVTVLGRSFATYGTEQTVCCVGGVGNGTLVPASVLDPQRILCTLPTFSAAGSVAVAVSLSGGDAGTCSAASVPFMAYVPPYVAAISPKDGNAQGGTLVTITGMGFNALSHDAAVRARYLRCAIASNAGPSTSIGCLSHNDTQVICRTSYGSGIQPVSIALNAVSFVSRGPTNGSAPTFSFKGLHPPSLLDVYFSPEGTTLVVQFDAQPTNRAGMRGLAHCSNVLDETTVAVLTGTASEPAECYWSDDVTLVVQLTIFTLAAGGMTVGVRPGVVWPKAWSYPGTCDGVNSKCLLAETLGRSMVVDTYLPCDQRTTRLRELCIAPIALIQAPNEIDSCSGTSVMLDASRSSGGGVRPLTYVWSALPRSSDNYYQIAAKLEASGSMSTILLGGPELNGGRSFHLMLIVRNFLGVSSTPRTLSFRRAELPVPIVTIEAPPLLIIPSSAKVTLEARASTAACFASNGSAIEFTWRHVAATVCASAL